MAATTTSSTGQVSRLQQTTERLRHESTQLRERLRGERDAVRALRAQHAAELRAERKVARRRRCELQAQLQEASKAKHKASYVAACEQCAKNKTLHEAEIRKINTEFKKREQQLKGQLNDKEMTTSSSSSCSSSCEQCTKGKALHDAEIRRLNTEFKKKEQQLKGQLNEKVLPTVTTFAVVASCEQCAKVKALYEAETRKLNIECKKKEQQLKGQLNELKKVASVDTTDGGVCQTCQRLHGDLTKQKEVSKDLEERLQKAIDADRLKAADLRAQHEKHVTELSKITRANKHDAHKLLEELKTKDRIIDQLRRSAGRARTKGEEAGIEHAQMRKLREEVRKNEQPALLSTTCDPKPETFTHHDKFRQNEGELHVTIKQRDQMVCGAANEDLTEQPETDTDSAVSSAPSSLSPQPCSPAANALRDRATPPPTSLSPQPSEGYTTPPPGLWPDLESYDDNEGRNSELSIARRQVRELERALLVTRATKSSSRHVTALSERVRQLEEREAELLRELGDLREQNELLEFRVLELAECPDKSSFSTSTWSVPENRDVATATDDVAERLNDEPMRRRLVDIASRTDDLEDKRCLMQILVLLLGLDELSKRTEPYVDTAMQIYNEREHTPPISLTSVRGSRDRTGPDRDRLVAKVPPFTGRTADSDDDRESPLRSHESSTSPAPVNSRGTQTDITETSSEEEESTKSLNLTVEVRKLDKLRETIDRNGRLVVSGSGCIGGCEQKHTKQLEFYRERVEVLERKLCVYESSGELQARQLAERLSREVILEAQVKQFTATVHKLQSENSRLEEERCELEEAENDTRLRCQRLEADILQLERSRMSAKRRARDSRQQAAYWETMVSKYEERNYELEERECELRHRLEVMEKTAPAIMLFNMWKTLQDEPKLDVISATIDRLKHAGSRGRSGGSQRSKSRSPRRDNSCVCEEYQEKIKKLEEERNKSSCVCGNLEEKIKILENERQKLVNAKEDMEKKVLALETQLTDMRQSATNTAAPLSGGPSLSSLMSGDFELMTVVQELRERENQMRKRIEELEQRETAYMETLQQADEIWADMENGYKKRISDAEQSEADMRDRLRRKEKQDPVNYDELDAERELAARAERLSRENSRLQAENKRLERELCQCLSQDDRVREIESKANKLNGELDRERRRSQALEQRLSDGEAALSEALRAHSVEAEALRERLARTANELVHLEVTNGELREEVDTLESKIAELDRGSQERAATDEQVIRGLSQELNDRDKELADMKQKDFAAEAGERLGTALQGVKTCDVCSQSVNPVLVDTVEGVRTLCQLMSCQDSSPADAQAIKLPSKESTCTKASCKAPCAPDAVKSETKEICPTASKLKKSAESTCTVASCKAPCAPKITESEPATSRVSFADESKETGAELVPVEEPSIEQFDLLTEVMVAGQPEYTSIQARVDMDTEHEIEGVTVMASVTDSGNLELTTESPPGLIEHTMTYTPSGNMEVTTGFSPRDSSDLDKVPSYFHREEEPLAPDIESQSQDQEPSLIQSDAASAEPEIQPVVSAEMVDVESTRDYSDTDGSAAKDYSDKDGSAAKDYSDKDESSARDYSDKDESPTRDYSDKDESPTRDYSDKVESPGREYSDKEESPARDYSDKDGSPTRDYSDEVESPTRDYADRDGSPTRDYSDRDESGKKSSISFEAGLSTEPFVSFDDDTGASATVAEVKSGVSSAESSIPQKTSLSVISDQVRKSSSGSGESLVELLKEVAHSSEKLAEILDRTSKFSSDKISLKSSEKSSLESEKSQSAKSSKGSAQSPSRTSSKGSAKSPSTTSSKGSAKSPSATSSKGSAKSPSAKSSKESEKTPSEKSSEVLETIASIKEMQEEEEEESPETSVCSGCAESETSEGKTGEGDETIYETPEGSKALDEEGGEEEEAETKEAEGEPEEPTKEGEEEEEPTKEGEEEEEEPTKEGEEEKEEEPTKDEKEEPEEPTKDVCVCRPKLTCACSTASQTMNAPRPKSESAVSSIGIIPVDLYGQPPGSQQLLCVCTMYQNQQQQQQPQQQCMPPSMIQGMAPQQMMPQQPMPAPYTFQPYVPCPAYPPMSPPPFGYPGTPMPYSSQPFSTMQQSPYQNMQQQSPYQNMQQQSPYQNMQQQTPYQNMQQQSPYQSIQQQSPYQSMQQPLYQSMQSSSDTCSPTCSGLPPKPRNLCEKYSCPAYGKIGEEKKEEGGGGEDQEEGEEEQGDEEQGDEEQGDEEQGEEEEGEQEQGEQEQGEQEQGEQEQGEQEQGGEEQGGEEQVEEPTEEEPAEEEPTEEEPTEEEPTEEEPKEEEPAEEEPVGEEAIMEGVTEGGADEPYESAAGTLSVSMEISVDEPVSPKSPSQCSSKSKPESLGAESSPSEKSQKSLASGGEAISVSSGEGGTEKVSTPVSSGPTSTRSTPASGTPTTDSLKGSAHSKSSMGSQKSSSSSGSKIPVPTPTRSPVSRSPPTSSSPQLSRSPPTSKSPPISSPARSTKSRSPEAVSATSKESSKTSRKSPDSGKASEKESRRSVESSRTPITNKSARGSKTSYHGKDCSCNVCKCNPCKDTRIPSRKRPDYDAMASECCPQCLCEVCRCPNCIDPSKSRGIPVQRSGTDDTSDGSASGLLEKKLLPHDVGLPCDCEECECGPCKDPNVLAKQGGSQFSSSQKGESTTPVSNLSPTYCSEPSTPSMQVDDISEVPSLDISAPAIAKAPVSVAKPLLTAAECGVACSCGPCLCDPCSDPNFFVPPKTSTPKVPLEAESTIGAVSESAPGSPEKRRSSVTFDLSGKTPDPTTKTGIPEIASPNVVQSASIERRPSGDTAVEKIVSTERRPSGDTGIEKSISVETSKSVRVGERDIEVTFPANQTDIRTLNITQTHPVDCDCTLCKCSPCAKMQGLKTTVILEPKAAVSTPTSAGSSDYFSTTGESNICTECTDQVSSPDLVTTNVYVCGECSVGEKEQQAAALPSTNECQDNAPGKEQQVAVPPPTDECTVCKDDGPTGDAAPCPLGKSVQVGDRTIIINKPVPSSNIKSVTVCPSGHPVDCDCIECVCNPCSKGAGTQTGATGVDSGTCPFMQTVQVADRTIGIHYPIAADSTRILNVCPTGHPVDCDCIKCICNPCSKTVGSQTAPVKPDIGQQGDKKEDKPIMPDGYCCCGTSTEQNQFVPNAESTRIDAAPIPAQTRAAPQNVTFQDGYCSCGKSIEQGGFVPVAESTRIDTAPITAQTVPIPQKIEIQSAAITADDSCCCDKSGFIPNAESTRNDAQMKSPGTRAGATGDDANPCPFMQSVKVADRIIGIHYPIAASTSRILNVCPSGHPVDCKCVICACNPCSRKTCTPSNINLAKKVAAIPISAQPVVAPQNDKNKITAIVADDSCCCDTSSKFIPTAESTRIDSAQTKNLGARAGATRDDAEPCPFMQSVQVADRKIGILYPIASSSTKILNVCPSSHPVDCQCIQCVCNPCSKSSGAGTQAGATGSDTKAKTDTESTTCICDTSPKSIGAQSGATGGDAEPCPFMQSVQVADRKIGILYPIASNSTRVLNVCPSGHPVDCQCIQCVCNPCSKSSGAGTQAGATGSDTKAKTDTEFTTCICDTSPQSIGAQSGATGGDAEPCPFMQSVQVADRKIGILYPIASNSTKVLNVCPSGHPVDCQCIQCVCNPCSKSSGAGAIKVGADTAHPADCECAKCICKPCSGGGTGTVKKAVTAPTTAGGDSDADAQSKKDQRVKVTAGDACDCVQEEDIPPCPFMKSVQVADRSIGIHYPIASSSTRTLNVCPSGHPVDCQCIKCICDPCSKNSPAATVPPKTDMKCLCDPCKDSSGTGDLQMVPHSALCDCPQCLCDPCAPPESEPVPERLPPSKLGPAFVKSTVKSSGSSKYELEMGKEAAVRSVAVSGTENWRNLDSDTLKQKLMGMENEARERANEIAQIRKFISGLQSQCVCGQKESGQQPQMAESRSFDQTISGLQCALAFLQEKCRKKDRMIVAFSEELRLRADSGVFNSVLHKIAAEREFQPGPDFDRITAANTLPKPADVMSRQVMRTPAEKPCAPPVKPASLSKKDGCCCNTGASQGVDPSPLAVTEVRRISPDSLLLKWDRPTSENIKGYEVEVNGEVKSRVHSAGRNATVLNGLEIDGTMNLSVVAISVDGDRCLPPATAVYEPRPSSPKNEKKGKCSC